MTPEGEAAVAAAAALHGVANPIEAAESVISGDDRLVKVIIKIRAAIADLNTEYEKKLNDLKEQKKTVEAEVLRRLNERGATSTKTVNGTSYITEKAQYTIADAEVYGRFVLEQGNTDFYQSRPKVETVAAWSKAHGGQLPPGLNVFRYNEIGTIAPKRKKEDQPEGDTDGE